MQRVQKKLLHGLYKDRLKLLLCEIQYSASIASKQRNKQTRTKHEFNLLLQQKLKKVIQNQLKGWMQNRLMSNVGLFFCFVFLFFWICLNLHQYFQLF